MSNCVSPSMCLHRLCFTQVDPCTDTGHTAYVTNQKHGNPMRTGQGEGSKGAAHAPLPLERDFHLVRQGVAAIGPVVWGSIGQLGVKHVVHG